MNLYVFRFIFIILKLFLHKESSLSTSIFDLTGPISSLVRYPYVYLLNFKSLCPTVKRSIFEIFSMSRDIS